MPNDYGLGPLLFVAFMAGLYWFDRLAAWNRGRRAERKHDKDLLAFVSHLDGVCNSSKCVYCEIDRQQAINPPKDPWILY